VNGCKILHVQTFIKCIITKMTKEEAVSKENKITVLESLIVISEF
jgi:hypothetical protein